MVKFGTRARVALLAGAMGAGALVMAAPAQASCYSAAGCQGPSVQQPPSGPKVGGSSGPTDPSSSTGSGLPFTGGDIAGMTAVGLGALGLGTALVYRSRRHTSPTTA